MSERRPIIRRRSSTRTPGTGTSAAGAPGADSPGTESSRIDSSGALIDLPLGDDASAGELGFDHGTDAGQSSFDEEPPRQPGAASTPRASAYRTAPPRGEAESRRPPGKKRAPIWPWLLFLLLLPLAAAGGYYLRPMPPVIALETDLLDFGDVRLGEEASARLRLRNDGEAALELLAVELAEDPDGLFERVEGSCGSQQLARGEGCELAFRFRPTVAGEARARLRLLSNAPAAAERSLPLIGRAVAPSLEVTPSRLDFGQATVGERGGRGQIRVSNRGSASVRVDGVSLEGLAAADFLAGEGCRGVVLEPGAGCDVRFEFIPTRDGVRSATVRLRAEAPVGEAPELRGRGLPQLPLLALEPDRLDFASLRVGTSGEPVEVRLRNDGNGPLDIRAVRVESSGVGGPESFRLDDLGCAGRRLDPGAGCRLQVAFTPVAEGPVGAVVDIEHSAAPGRHRLPLVGVGTAPRAEVSPGQLGFGDVARGQESPWRTLEVRNSGSAPLVVSRARLDGADARAFALSADGCLRAPIPPGQSCSVEVRFRARRDGPHRAELRIEHDAGARPGGGPGGVETVALNGLGTSARLGVDPVSLDFGRVTLGTTRLRELTLRNTGRAPLRLVRLRLVGAGLELERDCAGRVLAAGRSCVAAVRATPSRLGPLRGRLVIEHDAGPPREVPIELEARPRPKPELSIPARLSFTERYVGERSPIETVTLRNTGGARLELREMELEGAAAGDFRLVPGSCAGSVPPGNTCTVGIAFEPLAAGERHAALTIRHNAEGGTSRLQIYGLGVAR